MSTLPAAFDWTPTYLKYLQPRPWGDLIGDCVRGTLCYAMELRWILQCIDANVPVTAVRVSSLDMTAGNVNIWAGGGVCSDANWTYGLCIGSAAKAFEAQQAAVDTVPGPTAVANRANHILTTYTTVGGATFDEFVINCKQAILNGFPLSVFVPPNHEMVAWGWEGDQFRGLDTRSSGTQSSGPFFSDNWAGPGSTVGCVQKVTFLPDPPITSYPMTYYQFDLLQQMWAAAQTQTGGYTVTQDQWNKFQTILTTISCSGMPGDPPTSNAQSHYGTGASPGSGFIVDQNLTKWWVEGDNTIHTSPVVVGADGVGSAQLKFTNAVVPFPPGLSPPNVGNLPIPRIETLNPVNGGWLYWQAWTPYTGQWQQSYGH